MKKAVMITAGLMIGIAGLLSSCLEEFEKLDKIEKTSFEPSIDIPIINSEFNMEEMLTKGNSIARIETDPDGVFVLIYDDTVSSPPAGLFFILPSQQSPDLQINGLEVTAPTPGSSFTISKSLTFPLSTSNGQSLDSILIKAGQLAFDVNSTFRANVALTITIPSLIVGGQEFTQNIVLSGPGTQTPSQSLASSKIDLTDGGNTRNIVQFEISATITNTGSPITAAHSLSVSFAMNGLSFTAIFGDLKTHTFPLSSDINTDLFANTFEGEFELLSPAIRLDLRNSFGLPIGFDIQELSAIKKDNSKVTLSGPAVSSPANPYLIAAPNYSEVGEFKSSTIDLNPTNSNLPQLVSALPKSLAYQFELGLNPGSLETQNFVLDTSRLEIGVHLELPFHGRVSGLTLAKRFDFNGLGVEDIDEVSVKLKTINESPLDMAVQVYFVTANGTKLDSLFQDPRILEGAPVDANGFVSAPATVEMSVPITQADVDRMEQAEFIDVAASVFTSNNGTVPVKFSATDKLRLNLGVHIKMKYTVN